MKKIALIGCGNLGLSILNGLKSSSDFSSTTIYITKRSIASIEHLASENVIVTSNNALAIESSEIIIVALKPYNLIETISQLKEHFNPKKHVLVSLATGISIQQIKDAISTEIPIFRAMPNTAAGISESMTCICSNSHDEATKKEVRSIFDAIGETVEIEENLMEAATILGACGIAYVLRFMRAMVQGGIQIGFDAKTANAIVQQTVKGASELLIQNKQHPEFEIDKVTTPKGCTIVGLNEMEHNGFSSSLIKGLVASYKMIEK